MNGLGSYHLDYIRYPDVILPVALWPKYNLVQDKEYPEFDFCYCDVCRDEFKNASGVDPKAIADPPSTRHGSSIATTRSRSRERAIRGGASAGKGGDRGRVSDA